MHHWSSWIAALPLAGLFGCGGASIEVVPVSGVVKINGQPTEGVGVVFQPIVTAAKMTEAPQSTGVTDATGRFELSVPVTEQEGAIPGKHRVMFMAGVYPKDAPDGSPPAYEPIPPEYNAESTKEFDVPPDGTDTADFDLQIPNFKRTP